MSITKPYREPPTFESNEAACREPQCVTARQPSEPSHPRSLCLAPGSRGAPVGGARAFVLDCLGMAGTIFEWHGYLSTDPNAAVSAQQNHCPSRNGQCDKSGGVCAVTPSVSQEHVVICARRLHFDNYHFLRVVASNAFRKFDVALEADGLPSLTSGSEARAKAAQTGISQVGIFGKDWSGEIKLPAALPEGGRYSVDFTAIVVSPTGQLEGFVPVEVQTIDTTNSYATSVTALQNGQPGKVSNFGMNWENVNKRILPQLIVKGLMLQGERLCTTGMYFATPEPVFRRIMIRLGGVNRLRRIPPQPGSITFLRYEHDLINAASGSPVPMKLLETATVSTSDLSLAFITPENLPESGSYEEAIKKKL